MYSDSFHATSYPSANQYHKLPSAAVSVLLYKLYKCHAVRARLSPSRSYPTTGFLPNPYPLE